MPLSTGEKRTPKCNCSPNMDLNFEGIDDLGEVVDIVSFLQEILTQKCNGEHELSLSFQAQNGLWHFLSAVQVRVAEAQKKISK